MADEWPTQQRPAGWKKDPSGRHFGRYWDGEQWTEYVISAEKIQSIDPLPPRALETQPTQAATEPAPTQVAPTPALTEVMPAAPRIRGPVPTAPGRTPDAARSRGPVPVRLTDPADPRGRGENQILTAIRRWPRWAKWTAGAGVGLLLVAAAAGGGEDDDRPVSVVGQIETTLTLPVVTTLVSTTTALATTIPPTTIPPTTEAPTTVTTPATAPATTRATVAATAPPVTDAPTAPATTAAPIVRQGVTPGAFCSPGGASGATNTGLAMTCTTSATDERNRWRAS